MDKNRSKLPMLRSATKSKLPAPVSLVPKSAPPPLPSLATRTKRSRSPVAETATKRPRLDVPEQSKSNGPKLLRKANSLGSLLPPAGSRLLKKDQNNKKPNAVATRKPPVNTNQRPPLSRLNPPSKKTTVTSNFSTVPAGAVAAAGKKRPAWDVKGRLSDAQEQLEKKKALLSKQQDEFDQANMKLKNLKECISEKDEAIQSLQVEKSSMQAEANDLKKKIEEFNVKFDQMKKEKVKLEASLSKTQSEKTSLQDVAKQLNQQLETAGQNLLKIEQLLKSQLEELNNNCTQIKLEKHQISETLETTRVDLIKKSDERDRLSSQLDSLQTQFKDLQTNYTNTTVEKSQLSTELINTQDKLEKQCKESERLNTQLSSLQNSFTELQSNFNLSSQDNVQLRFNLQTSQKNLEDITASDKLKAEMIEKQKTQILEHETNRRKLHNTIQELRGNIRVFCRVRPLIGDELKTTDGAISHMHFPDQDDNKVLEMERLDAKDLSESTLSSRKKHEFTFDRVFDPNSTQEEAFIEISQLVQSALDGYNVCIFAYGQTGSGKTYTMEGGADAIKNVESRGMIPRAVQQVFDASMVMKENGWQFTFDVSFLEIYNETIRDLLSNDGIISQTKHDIKIAGNNSHDVMVTNLTTVNVESADQVLSLLIKASRNRAVAETKCNARSSRSHSVFIFKLSCKNSITQQSYEGVLNLVDLAGSERLKESGSEGERLKETQAINTSLSNLGNVIMAIGNKDSHIPYRNSKLTYLLKNSLGGNSKTLMFINVSPKVDSYNETLNSLRFATKVNQCHIGVAHKKSAKK